jgi:hypothetical protein
LTFNGLHSVISLKTLYEKYGSFFIDDMVSSAEHMASNDSVINANILKRMWKIEFGA